MAGAAIFLSFKGAFMSSILRVAQPLHEMNYIPGVGRFICIATAVQKAYCAWENFKTLQKIENTGRTKAGDKVREQADKAASKVPLFSKLASRIIPDSSRSVLHNLKPLGENLGWLLLLTACATNYVPGTASLGILFSLYARPWTQAVRGTQWPLVGGCLLWSVICFEPLDKLAPLVDRVVRSLL
jgi:hypothetical protein